MANNDDDFGELYTNYIDATVGYIVRFGFSKEEARDLAQDTFIRVYQGMPTYRGEARWAFIQKTARNVALNEIRDRHAQKRDASLTVPAGENVVVKIADKKRSPEEQAAINELLERAYNAIREMSKDKQDCILHALNGHTYREIAAMLGIPENRVKSRLHEARQQLKLYGIELPP